MARKKASSEKKDQSGNGGMDLGDRYRRLFEASQDAIMLLDRERFFDCNPATLRMFGLTREEFIRLHPSEISPPRQPNGFKSRAEADRRIDEAFKSGANKFVWVHRRASGEDFLVTVWLTALALEGRQVLQATVREVSADEESHMDLEAHRLKLQLLLDERSEVVQKESEERKRAEREVRRLIAAIETSFDAVAIFDLDMNLTYANNAFCKMSKYPREKLKGISALKFISGPSVGVIRDLITNAMDGNDIPPFDIEITDGTGGHLWVEIAGTLIYGDDGLPEGYLVIASDISERKSMIDSLRKSEEKFKNVVERSLDGILIIQDGKVAYMNPALLKLSGATLEEQIGRDFIENVAPEEREMVLSRYQARMDGETLPRIYEITLAAKDGRRIPVEINAGMTEYQGKPADFVYIRDLSERRKALGEIQTLMSRFEHVLGATRTGFDVIDEDFNVVYVDPAWAKVLGDYKGKKCHQYFMGRKGVCETCAIPEALRTGRTTVSEEYLEREDRFVEVHTIPLAVESGKRQVAEFNVDITERKRAETALRESENRLRSIYENAKDMIFTKDESRRYTYLNPSMERFLGLPAGDIIGKKPEELFDKDSCKAIRNVDDQAFSGKVVDEVWPLRVKGKTFHLHTVQTPLDRKNGKVTSIMGIVRDITEQREMEASMKDSEARYRELANGISSGLAVYKAVDGGKDFEIMDFNAAAERIEGISREDVIGKPVTEAFPGIEKMGLLTTFRRVWKTGKPEHHPTVLYQDKRVTGWRANYVYRLPSGEIVAIYDDLTDKIKAEKALRESDERIRSLFTSMEDLVFGFDSEGRFTSVQTPSDGLLYIPPEQFVGKKYHDVMPPHVTSLIDKGFRRNRKRETHDFEYQLEIAGQIRWFSAKMSPIFIEREFNGSVAVVRDITNRMAIENALAASKEQLNALFQASTSGIGVELNEKLFFVNPAFVRMFGFSEPEEILGKPLAVIVNPGDRKRVSGYTRLRVKGKAPPRYEFTGIRKDGTTFDVEASVSAYHIGGDTYFVGFVQDITDRKAAERALRTSEQVYRSLYESTTALGELKDLDRFMEVIAEQARNMLGGVCSTIYLWDGAKGLLVPHYSNVVDEKEKFMAFEMPLGTGLTGSVAKRMEGGYANYDDPKAKKAYVPGTRTTQDHLQSIIAEPLLHEGELLGVINVIAVERVYTDDDLAKLRILARQTALAYMHLRNITELQASEERFRRMAEGIHDGLTIIENGSVTYINDRAVEIYGYPREELMGMTHMDLVVPEDKVQMRQIVAGAMETGVSLGEIEFWIQRKDGTRRYVRTRTSTSMEGDAKSEFIITTDITARKQAEDENKRMLMKFLLEDGRMYLVKEFRPTMSIDALNDLLNLEYVGLVLSRTPKKDIARSIHGAFEHIWLGESAEEGLFERLLATISGFPGKTAVLIDRLDYLVFRFGFKETLDFIFKLRDLIYLREKVVIISIDPSTIKDDELNIIQKEMSEIEARQVPRPGEDVMEIAQLIYDRNSAGIKPSYSELGEELKMSKPTFRKRVRRLISAGYVAEVTKGNKKVLELTQKGRSLFFK